jgi:hypothetical protein
MKLSVAKYFCSLSHVQDTVLSALDDFKTPKSVLLESLKSELRVCADLMDKNELLGQGELLRSYMSNQSLIYERQIRIN